MSRSSVTAWRLLAVGLCCVAVIASSGCGDGGGINVKATVAPASPTARAAGAPVANGMYREWKIEVLAGELDADTAAELVTAIGEAIGRRFFKPSAKTVVVSGLVRRNRRAGPPERGSVELDATVQIVTDNRVIRQFTVTVKTDSVPLEEQVDEKRRELLELAVKRLARAVADTL